MSQVDSDTQWHQWQPPREFEEYEIVRPLGHGAMGHVYLARDRLLDRLVAIKFIARLKPDRLAHERFSREARAIARLQHPNVVSVYRVGQISGRPYMVSEYVAGRPLDQVAAPAPPEQVLELAIGLARGLAAAHRFGVLHRDIKPANTLLADSGEVKLLDFGLAKLVDEDAAPAALTHAEPRPSRVDATDAGDDPRAVDETVDLATSPRPDGSAPDTTSSEHEVAGDGLVTAAGQWIGTPLYMAPELWNHAPATRRSDIYSLGAVLYHLATGRAPHLADDIAALNQLVISTDPPPLAELAADCPAALAAIIHRCLARDPADRFASADALREALEATRSDDRDSDAAIENPYRGLRAYAAEHKRWFFGRDPELRAVLDRLRAAPVVVLAGDSGTGKSSLCHAGVVPAVVDGALHDRSHHTTTVISLLPGRRPLDALAAALAPHLDMAADEVAEALRDQPLTLARRVRKRHDALVVFVDQFEEMLTLAAPDQAGDAARALAALTVDSSAARLLATVRSDYLSRVAALPGLGGAIADGLYLLRPMSQESIREIITAPAARCGVHFESEQMIAELADFVARSPGGLPLLQFTLAELWQRRDRNSARIPAAALAELGGVDGALARHAENVFLPLDADMRGVAKQLLTRLVSADGAGLRRSRDELLDNDSDSDSDSAPRAQVVLETLVRGRLIIAGEPGEHDRGTYRLAHEALVEAWPRMREWLRRDAAERALRDRLERAARDWQRLGRSRDSLWTGRQLREARELVEAGQPGRLGAREHEFLRASVAARRRAALLRWGTLAAAITVIMAAWLGVRAQARAQRNAEIHGQLAAAEKALDEARQHARQGRDQRQRAFARFDAHEPEGHAQGERLWQRALASERDAISAYRRAERAIAAALRVDPGRARSRALMAEVLDSLARLAHEGYRYDERDRLIEELGVHERDRMEAWTAPAAVVIDRQPDTARVRVFRYRQDDSGRLRPEPVAVPAVARTVQLEPGSYVLELAAPGFATVRYPVVVSSEQQQHVTIRLPAAGDVPEGFVHVAPGVSLMGSGAPEGLRDGFFAAPPLHPVFVDGFLISATEVTMAQWLEYIDDLPPDQRDQRAPNAGHVHENAGLRVARDQSGQWQIELYRAGETLRAVAGQPLRYPERDRRVDQDWLRMPVAGVSFDDAQAYAAWLDRTGRVPRARLCTSLEWERAARGADHRRYPGGWQLLPDDANFDETYGRKPLAFGADEVGSHPMSQSPFGVDDMAGNVWEWVVRPGGGALYRGGSWYQAAINADIANREPGEPEMRNALVGVRMCASPAD